MCSIKDFIIFNVARFDRMRRRPLLDILTFMIKRSKQVVVHLRDRLHMVFHDIVLSDSQFFHKVALERPELSRVRNEVDKVDLEQAKIEIMTYMKNRDVPRFHFNRGERQKLMKILESRFPESRRRTIELAEEILTHRFYFLGKNVHFDGKINWHSSLTNDKRWPFSFSPNIDYFSAHRIGDIKLAWELNRTQHFTILGKAYWYTGDERYAKEFANQLLSWIRENPYKLGINWMEGIEIALRMFSWIWSYYFFLDSECFDKRVHFEFLKCVYMHAKFIMDHLSDKWQINNNHLISEAAGLALIGIIFPEFKEAERWRKRGMDILESELDIQILPDGVDWEQSTGYHKFVTDLYLQTVNLAMRNGVQVSKAFLSKLSQMIEFLNYITKTDGRIPVVGDGDDARVVRIDETDYDDARSTLRIGSIIFNRQDLLSVKSEEAFWLLGEESLAEGSEPVSAGNKIFRDGGYVVFRGKDRYLLFVVGPQSSKYLHASHKHLDMLSLILDAYGTCFLVDPGTYTYFGDFKWRKYFKGTKAHNTIVVDHKDPVDIEEAFELSRVPFARIINYATENKTDWVEARHDGYFPVSHVRVIIFVKQEYWVIIDLLEGSGEHRYDLYFHFNHGLEIRINEKDQSILATGLTGSVKINPLVTSGLRGEILRGEISSRYGTKVEAPILRYSKRGSSQIFVTLLYPYKNGSIGERLARSIKVSQINVFGKRKKRYKDSEVIGIKIDFGAYVDYIIHSHEEKCISLGIVKQAGKIMHFRKEREKDLRAL